MDFGLGLLGYSGCWDDAAYAEQHGFATAGMVDSPLLGADPFVCLALAARATERIRLGTFLAVPSNRSAATTAVAIASVARVAPGRTFLGLATGYTSRNTFGLGPLSADRLAGYAAECRRLLDGGEIEREGRPPYRLLHADGYVDTSEIPIYLAADGPKALAATGAVADGWVSTMQRSHLMATSADVFADSLTAIRHAAAEAARTGPGYKMLSTGVCLLDDGEPANSPRALGIVGPLAMLAFHTYADSPAIADYLPTQIQERLPIYEREVLARFPDPSRRYQSTHTGHLSHLLPGEEQVLTDEIVRMTTLCGTPAEVAHTLQRLAAAGLDNVSFWIPPAHTRDTIVDVETRLMPLLRATSQPTAAS